MPAVELTGISLAIASAIAVLIRKSKCFIRKLGDGTQSWAIGITDRPLVPSSPIHKDVIPIPGCPGP